MARPYASPPRDRGPSPARKLRPLMAVVAVGPSLPGLRSSHARPRVVLGARRPRASVEQQAGRPGARPRCPRPPRHGEEQHSARCEERRRAEARGGLGAGRKADGRGGHGCRGQLLRALGGEAHVVFGEAQHRAAAGRWQQPAEGKEARHSDACGRVPALRRLEALVALVGLRGADVAYRNVCEGAGVLPVGGVHPRVQEAQRRLAAKALLRVQQRGHRGEDGGGGGGAVQDAEGLVDEGREAASGDRHVRRGARLPEQRREVAALLAVDVLAGHLQRRRNPRGARQIARRAVRSLQVMAHLRALPCRLGAVDAPVARAGDGRAGRRGTSDGARLLASTELLLHGLDTVGRRGQRRHRGAHSGDPRRRAGEVGEEVATGVHGADAVVAARDDDGDAAQCELHELVVHARHERRWVQRLGGAPRDAVHGGRVLRIVDLNRIGEHKAVHVIR
mmetsp:Transcript_103329/g.287754  ORF Transcript_103329/g.287754 Transcript_103329/m.287754 type:complete len:450 (-) Transcript_103329:183-1532(-)